MALGIGMQEDVFLSQNRTIINQIQDDLDAWETAKSEESKPNHERHKRLVNCGGRFKILDNEELKEVSWSQRTWLKVKELASYVVPYIARSGNACCGSKSLIDEAKKSLREDIVSLAEKCRAASHDYPIELWRLNEFMKACGVKEEKLLRPIEVASKSPDPRAEALNKTLDELSKVKTKVAVERAHVERIHSDQKDAKKNIRDLQKKQSQVLAVQERDKEIHLRLEKRIDTASSRTREVEVRMESILTQLAALGTDQAVLRKDHDELKGQHQSIVREVEALQQAQKDNVGNQAEISRKLDILIQSQIDRDRRLEALERRVFAGASQSVPVSPFQYPSPFYKIVNQQATASASA